MYSLFRNSDLTSGDEAFCVFADARGAGVGLLRGSGSNNAAGAYSTSGIDKSRVGSGKVKKTQKFKKSILYYFTFIIYYIISL